MPAPQPAQDHLESREVEDHEDEEESMVEEILEWVHRGGGIIGGIYRLIVGIV